MKRLNFSFEQLTASWVFWSSDESLQRELRFGQYIYNKFAPVGAPAWTELFYEKDHGISYHLLFNN